MRICKPSHGIVTSTPFFFCISQDQNLQQCRLSKLLYVVRIMHTSMILLISLKINLHSDAYKEFEKEIQEDLQEVDDRLEEEEVRLLVF